MKSNKERFIELLRSTGRENIDYLIEDLESLGFFEAPASKNNHHNYAGGLLEHSLNVYDMAVKVRSLILELRPTLEPKLPPESVIIAALLHDVCKSNIYRKATRSERNPATGQWEQRETYNLDYSAFPCGHGEKSAIMLLQSGLEMTDDEVLAIRWHMGGWDIPFQSSEMTASIREAGNRFPLVTVIQVADTLAAKILESTDIEKI